MEKWNLEPKAIPSEWKGNWLVLRCGTKSTLKLVSVLAERGVRAWTPLWVHKRRHPRSTDFTKVVTPSLPSFVFVPEGDIDLAQAMTGLPGFSVMKSYGVTVRLRNEELTTLRKAADLDSRRNAPFVWPTLHKRYRITSGAFAGLEGRVIGKSANLSVIDLESPGFNAVKIAPFLLSIVEA